MGVQCAQAIDFRSVWDQQLFSVQRSRKEPNESVKHNEINGKCLFSMKQDLHEPKTENFHEPRL